MKGKNFKHIPTAKLKEILNDPFTRGVDGSDYAGFKDELQDILWERESREENIEKLLAEREQY